MIDPFSEQELAFYRKAKTYQTCDARRALASIDLADQHRDAAIRDRENHELLVALCRAAHGEPPSYGALQRGVLTRKEYDDAKTERFRARDAIKALVFG